MTEDIGNTSGRDSCARSEIWIWSSRSSEKLPAANKETQTDLEATSAIPPLPFSLLSRENTNPAAIPVVQQHRPSQAPIPRRRGDSRPVGMSLLACQLCRAYKTVLTDEERNSEAKWMADHVDEQAFKRLHKFECRTLIKKSRENIKDINGNLRISLLGEVAFDKPWTEVKQARMDHHCNRLEGDTHHLDTNSRVDHHVSDAPSASAPNAL